MEWGGGRPRVGTGGGVEGKGGDEKDNLSGLHNIRWLLTDVRTGALAYMTQIFPYLNIYKEFTLHKKSNTFSIL